MRSTIFAWRSGVDCEPRFVQRLVAKPVPMLRSAPEEIDEAGIRVVACYCGSGRD